MKFKNEIIKMNCSSNCPISKIIHPKRFVILGGFNEEKPFEEPQIKRPMLGGVFRFFLL